MKTIKALLLTTFLSAAVAIAMPVSAQQTPNSSSAQTENYADDGNDRNFSWVGLLGLLGLAGLISKKRHEVSVRPA